MELTLFQEFKCDLCTSMMKLKISYKEFNIKHTKI